MSSNNIHVFFLISMVWFLTLINNEYALEFRQHDCSNTTTFKINSTYQSNLNHLLSSLVSNTSSSNTTGFYYTSVGQEPGTQVHGSFLCRGDVSPGACENCVKTAVNKSTEELCPIEKVAVIWYDECMLRYSNESYKGKADELPGRILYNTANVSGDSPEKFEELLVKTMDELEAKANEGSIDGKKFATKEVNFSNYSTFYNLVQCTPDLSSFDCKICLQKQVNQLPNCCGGKQGANLMNPSCNIRYEGYEFYNVQPSPPTSGRGLSPPQSKGEMKSTRVLTLAQCGPSDQRINGSDWRVFTKLDQGDWGQRYSFHAARRASGSHVSHRPASEWAPHVGCADSPEAIADRWIRSTVQIEARPSKLSRTEPLVLTVHPSGVHPQSSNGKWRATCLINIPANKMVTRGMHLVK